MKHYTHLSSQEAEQLLLLIGKDVNRLSCGVVSAVLDVDGKVVEFFSETEPSSEMEPFGSVARVALRVDPQRPYESDMHEVGRDLGKIMAILLVHTAVHLTDTRTLQAIPANEEATDFDEPMAAAPHWVHPRESQMSGIDEAIFADVGVLLQTETKRTVWIYAPFGPYLGIVIYETNPATVVPQEVSHLVEVVGISERLQ